MSQAITIAQRELSSMLRVPAGWIIIALFAFLTAMLFVSQSITPGSPGTLRYFFAYSGWLLIPIAPAISMRLMSEEYRSGSFESLRTAPTGDWSVTLGKYLGSLAFLLLMLVPTLIYPIVLTLVSSPAPDIGPIIAGYLMLVLVGMLYLAIGMVASSLTSSQMLAFLGTIMTLVMIMVLTSGVIVNQVDVKYAAALKAFAIMPRIEELSKGIIDTSTIAFFLIGTAWMLVLASGVLEILRLGKSKSFTAITASAFFLVTGVCVIFAGSITNTYTLRTDVTSTGSHKLSPRAISIVDRLTDPTEIVLAVRNSNTDLQALDLVSDVLDAYSRSSELLNVRTINLDSPDGRTQIDTLLADLARRDQSKIDSNKALLADSADIFLEMVPMLGAVTTKLQAISNAIDPSNQMNANNRAVFVQRASLFSRYANDMETLGERIHEQITAHDPSTGIFPFDTYSEPIETTLAQIMNQLDELSVQISTFANAAGLAPEAQAIASPMSRQLESLRDQAAVAHDRITRLEPIDALRVGRALDTGEALLVIGPSSQGIAAIDLNTLLPSAVAIERAGISAAGYIGPRAQELVASAIAQLVAPTQPIVVFVHAGQPNELLSASNLLNKTVEKLAAKGIDTLEWAAVEQPTPPDLDTLDPLGIRPTVFIIISPDSSRGTDESGLSGSKRATEMGNIISTLLNEGQALLVSLSPSIFPTSNIPDPIADALAPMGIFPDAGRPLLHEKMGDLGLIADPVTTIVPKASTPTNHPIANAISGLTTVLPWSIPLELSSPTDTSDVETWAVVETPGNNQTWAETNWVSLKNTPLQSRSRAFNQPIFDEDDDARSDRWVLASASQRTHAGAQQRMIVVGSNGWFVDSITSNEQLVDGRIVSPYPGNLTLFESSIAWLAGMDDLIGPGTSAHSIATIKPLDDKQLGMIRWLLLAGLPGLILLLGIASRMIFG